MKLHFADSALLLLLRSSQTDSYIGFPTIVSCQMIILDFMPRVWSSKKKLWLIHKICSTKLILPVWMKFCELLEELWQKKTRKKCMYCDRKTFITLITSTFNHTATI